ncbi:MAG TPA: hypothetical protein VI336_03675 [Candidatus Saccharimonadales bacterium]|nr:hypothetical protein [Candidatus Saccharimonadales bacterium]
MQRYKIFAAVFLIIAYSLATFAFFDNRKTSVNTDTLSNLSQANTKIQNYVVTNSKLPVNATQISLDSSITYRKYSDSIYVLCANFSQAKKTNSDYSSTYGNTDTTGQQQINSAIQELRSKEPETNYVASGRYLYAYGTSYKKGRNCYVVYYAPYSSATKTNISNTNMGKIKTKCDSSGATYGVKGEVLVDGLFDDRQAVTFKQNDQNVIDDASQKIPEAISYKYYNSTTKVYDADCKFTTISSIKSGQKITYYANTKLDAYMKVIEL